MSSSPTPSEIFDLNSFALIGDEADGASFETPGIESSSPKILSDMEVLASDPASDLSIHDSDRLAFTFSEILNGEEEISPAAEGELDLGLKQADIVGEEEIFGQDINEDVERGAVDQNGVEFTGSADGMEVELDQTGKIEEDLMGTLVGDLGVHRNEDISAVNVDEKPARSQKSAFAVSDLVWGKVKSHPWWPGQIFDPSDASDLALKHQKKDHFLIGCFGDKSFAWLDERKLRPFHEFFSELAHQNASDVFVSAVNNALAEVSRRAELVMSCRCLPQTVLKKIETQKIENAGIRRKSSVVVPSEVFSWYPEKYLDFIKDLARYPREVVDKLELNIVKAQTISLYHSRGLLTSKGRRKGEDDDGFEFPGKRKKRKLHKLGGHEGKTPTSFKIGECISRAASKLTESPFNGQILPRNALGNGEQLSRDMLSQLALAARDSVKGHAFLSGIVPFFIEIRKLRDASFKKRRGRKKVETVEEPTSGTPKKRGRKKKSELEVESKKEEETETHTQDYMTDSYWTDRLVSPPVVQSTRRKKTKLSQDHLPLSKLEVAHHLRIDAMTAAKRELEKTGAMAFSGEKRAEEDRSHTALILSFGEAGAIPSETELLRIYGRYGPLREAETRVDAVSKSAKVVFRRRTDAEVAFSCTGQFGFFSPSLLSFRLKSPPSPPPSPQPSLTEDFLALDEFKEAESVGK